MLRNVLSGLDEDRLSYDEKKKKRNNKLKREKAIYHKNKKQNFFDINEWSLPPLCQAVYKRDVNKVSQLLMLDQSRHMYEKDQRNRTPLHFAVLHDSYGILALLLESPIAQNLFESRDNSGKTALFKATECCAFGCLKLLISFGCNTTSYDKTGTTPLHVAVLAQQLQLIEILVNAKANINSIDQVGFTPLHLCCGLGFVDGVKLLLLNNANPNLRDRKGRTPIFAAATEKEVEVIDVLLKYGANPSLIDDEGKSPAIHLKEKVKSHGKQWYRRRSRRRSMVKPSHKKPVGLNKYDKEVMKIMSPSYDMQRSSAFVNNETSDTRDTEDEQWPSPRRFDPKNKSNTLIQESLVTHCPCPGSETSNDLSNNSLPHESKSPINAKYLPRTGQISPGKIVLQESFLTTPSSFSTDEETKETIKRLEQSHINDDQDITSDENLDEHDRHKYKVVSLAQEKKQYLHKKNRELLEKKLKHCKSLQNQMNSLVNNLVLPKVPRKNSRTKDSSKSLQEENNVLQKQIVSLLQKNAELHEDVTQFRLKHKQPHQNRTTLQSPENVQKLHLAIDELLQENLEIKQEIKNIKSNYQDKSYQDKSLLKHDAELIHTKEQLLALKSQIEEEKTQRVALESEIKRLQQVNTALSGRISMLSNRTDSKQSFSKRTSLRNKKKKPKAPQPPSVSHDVIETQKGISVDTPTPSHHSFLEKTEGQVFDHLKEEKQAKGKKEETGSIGEISNASSSNRKMRVQRLKFWKINI